MKCDEATIAELCSRPGVRSMGLAVPNRLATPGKEVADHIAEPGKLARRNPRNKYGAIPTTYNGVRYASKAEAARAERLDLLQASGVIRFWIGQPKFRLGVPENVYVADFLVVMPSGTVRVEDVKGKATAKFNRDVKLWRAYGPCDLIIIRNGRITETITPTAG